MFKLPVGVMLFGVSGLLSNDNIMLLPTLPGQQGKPLTPSPASLTHDLVHQISLFLLPTYYDYCKCNQ